jgi:peptidyl-prolyl cis-trans isomerase SurA
MILLRLCFGFLMCLVGSVAWAGVVDRVVAVVDEEVITLSEVYELGDQFIQQRCARSGGGSITQCMYEAEVEILDSLITRTLVKQKLIEVGMAVTPEEVDRTINRIMRDENILDRDAFKAAVTEQGWNWSTYKDELSQQIQQMKFNQSFIMPRVSVSDDEIRNVYNRTQREFASKPKRVLEALSVQLKPGIAKDELTALMTKLAKASTDINGGSLDWMQAIENLDSGVYKERKGQMGSFQEGELIEELKPVFALDVGQVSAPLKVANSLMLIKVIGETEGSIKGFDEVKDQIKDQLFQAQVAEEMEQWVQAQRRKSSVRVLLADKKD